MARASAASWLNTSRMICTRKELSPHKVHGTAIQCMRCTRAAKFAEHQQNDVHSSSDDQNVGERGRRLLVEY